MNLLCKSTPLNEYYKEFPFKNKFCEEDSTYFNMSFSE